jgi:hypothetical protein
VSESESRPAFEWVDFQELARCLVEHGEAGQRTAVSRSYYAAFHMAQAVLAHLDSDYASMRSQDSHKQVWDRLEALDRRQAKTAARGGRSLLRERKAADSRHDAHDWPRRSNNVGVCACQIKAQYRAGSESRSSPALDHR